MCLAFVLILAVLVAVCGGHIDTRIAAAVCMCAQPKVGEPDSDILSCLYSKME